MTPFSEWTPLLDGTSQYVLLSLSVALIAYHHTFYNQLLGSPNERAPKIGRLLDVGARWFYLTGLLVLVRISVLGHLENIEILQTKWLAVTDMVIMAPLIGGVATVILTAREWRRACGSIGPE